MVTSPRRAIAASARALACAAICLSTAGLAEELPEPTEHIVEVRGKNGTDSERTTYSVEREAIHESAPGSLADALRFAPSVSVQQTTPGQGTIYVRGFSGRAVVHVIDGVRVNSAIFRAGNNPYLGLLDPYAMKTVEVIPGAASVRHGGDGLGGAVLLSTPLPGYRLGGGATTTRMLQGVTLNPLGGVARVEVDHADEAWTLHGGVTAVRAGAIRPGEGKLSPIPSMRTPRDRDHPFRAIMITRFACS